MVDPNAPMVFFSVGFAIVLALSSVAGSCMTGCTRITSRSCGPARPCRTEQ